eukprot:1187486-Rhodomonas_salina.2
MFSSMPMVKPDTAQPHPLGAYPHCIAAYPSSIPYVTTGYRIGVNVLRPSLIDAPEPQGRASLESVQEVAFGYLACDFAALRKGAWLTSTHQTQPDIAPYALSVPGSSTIRFRGTGHPAPQDTSVPGILYRARRG